jgi:glycerol-3-phosphate dehydrogenase (NAD(P)+)
MPTRPDGGTTTTRVAVIGAGSWGSTFASMLAEGCDTVVWAREPEVAEAISTRHENPVFLPEFRLAEPLHASSSLDEVVGDQQLIVMAVPAQHLRAVAQRVADRVSPTAAVVSLAKGIEQGTLLRPSQILTEVLVEHDPSLVGVVSGPNLAREVMAGQPSATVVAIPDETAARQVQSLLMTDRFRVYTSADVVGCEIGGAVKNVIAIAVGMADGLGFGWNTRAALITRGLAELTRLGVALGGQALTFLGLAGNGDLIATCSSPQSRNRRVGVELGRGRSLPDILADTSMVAEGVTSTPAVLELAHMTSIELPIAAQVQSVLAGQSAPAAVVSALMRREATTELHDLPPLSRD